MSRKPKSLGEIPDRVALPPRLEEFRTALEEEIKAAQSNKSSESLLTAGQFVAMVAGEFLYEFETASPVRVPPDTPGELTIEGLDAPVPVTVVKIDELEITLASKESLGRAPTNAKLRTNLTMLLRRLIARIEEKAVETWPAAERLLDGGPVAGEPLSLVDPKDGDGRNLNKEQHAAVECALGRNMTFIWGPPGTGKTQTIGSIGRELFARGRTLLLVSHTNVAVDEALHRIATLCGSSFAEGEIIRIGEPVKAEMLQRTDLISHHIAARRKEALQQKRIGLEEEKNLAFDRLRELERLVTVVEWAEEATADVDAFRVALTQVQSLEEHVTALTKELARAEEEKPLWEIRRKAAAEAQLFVDRQSAFSRASRAFRRRLDELADELLKIRNARGDAEQIRQLAREAEPLRQRRAALPIRESLQSELQQATNNQTNWCAAHEACERRFSEAMDHLKQAESMGTIRRLWHKLPDPLEQAQLVEQARQELAATKRSLEQAVLAKAEVEAQLQELDDLAAQLSSLQDIPTLIHQDTVCAKLASAEASTLSLIADDTDKLRQAEVVLSQCDEQLLAFQQSYTVEPEELIRQVTVAQQNFNELYNQRQASRVAVGRKRAALDSEIRDLLIVLRQVGLSETAEDAPLHEKLIAVEQAHSKALSAAQEHSCQQLLSERDELRSRIPSLDDEIKAIEDQIARVELDIILNARVIATTLTRSFMRDALQQRRFDTVLCDEASMAPIPALWAAATLASSSVVAVGDFLQLPPIVQAEHSIAKKWLGRDIFEVSGVERGYQRGRPPCYFVALKRQFRMHPAIADAPNALIYDGNLINEEWVSKAEADKSLLSWYETAWGFDQPLLLVDMAKTGAWNNKSGNSRLNFLSAALSVRIAGAVLRSDRPKWESKEGRRIFIITPYRPQAALINMMLREQNISGEVQASTAHSCQGGEAQFVILDLVVDEPHYSTNLTAKANSTEIRRLLNVAMTRAKRRLVVLGNFAWLQMKGRGGFVGGELLPYLLDKHQPRTGSAILAATVNAVQTRTIQTDSVLEELTSLIQRARQQIVVMSPSVDTEVLATLTPSLVGACKRGVKALLLIRPITESRMTAEERAAIETQVHQLRQEGVDVAFKTGMHEKIVLVDSRVVWTCTFPPLSVEREGLVEEQGQLTAKHRLRLYEEIVDCLGLEHVFSSVRDGLLQCPVCGDNLWMADTGPKSPQPFYWKCAKAICGYSRSINEPPVVEGVITFACGGQPALDYRGDDPIWICDCGKRHRCRIKGAHVRLPKMWALVPKHRRNRLLRELEMDAEDLIQTSSTGPLGGGPGPSN